MRLQHLAWTIVFLASGNPAWAQDFYYPGTPPPGQPVPGAPGGVDYWPPPAQLPLAGTPAWQPAGPAGGIPPGDPYYRQGGTGPVSPPPIAQPVVAPALAERLVESTWYTRVDYFHWNERYNGRDFVNEDGPLLTLGYVRRVGVERFRAELFGGSVHYGAEIEYDDGTTEPLSSVTNYLGIRGEYDLLIHPEWWPQVDFFVGVGTRFWFRDLPDDVTASGTQIIGYQETWWTIYPYVGIERRRVLTGGLQFYGSGRIGFTAVTSQHVTWDDVRLYPRPGITGQLEGGLRGRTFFLSAFFEAMTWEESAVVRDSLQPASRMFTTGLRSGFTF